MKRERNRDKYAKALQSVPVTEYKDLLIETKNKRLKKISPLEVTYEGMKFGLVLNLYGDLQECVSRDKKAIGHTISTFIATLKEKGYDTPNVELNSLIEDLNHLIIIEPSKQYDVFSLRVDGTVASKHPLLSNDIVLETKDVPDDYDKGYWRIIDGIWVLDKELYNNYWGSL